MLIAEGARRVALYIIRQMDTDKDRIREEEKKRKQRAYEDEL